MADFFQPRDLLALPRTGKRERLAVGAGVVPLTVGTYKIQPAAGLNLTAPNDILPTSARIQVLSQPINFTVDGTPATNLIGFVGQDKDMIYLNTYEEIVKFSATRNGGTDAAIEVQYYYGR